MNIDAIIIGRHISKIPGVNVIEHRDVFWPHDLDEIMVKLDKLIKETDQCGAYLLLQNCPTSLAAYFSIRTHRFYGGFIVGKKGYRTMGKLRRFVFNSEDDAKTAMEALRWANGRANVFRDHWAVSFVSPDIVPFEYSHIMWNKVRPEHIEWQRDGIGAFAVPE